MKKTSTCLLLVFLLSIASVSAQKIFFSDIKESSIKVANQRRVIIPQKYRTVLLDTIALKVFLKTLTEENKITDYNTTPVIAIPLPNGTISYFRIWESSVMELGLAAKFPNIKTYTGQGIDDRTATLKIDWTEEGFHAMILSPVTTTIAIDPYSRGNKINYISYFKSDYKKDIKFSEEELLPAKFILSRPVSPNNILSGQCIGTQLRNYRLAIACTGEYADSVASPAAPTVALTLSHIVTSVNRINGIYETELDIHFNLVSNENAIIFTDPATDPFTNASSSNLGKLIHESQTAITTYIGESNYDIGHTFSTILGGYSVLGIVCLDGQKAQSATGLLQPYGDLYDVDYVAHEIGHEFNATHSFNSVQGFCGATGQFFGNANSEPGSGSTIMCYASGAGGYSIICGSDNLQQDSDPYFNAIGFDQITQYINSGSGSGCAVVTAIGNHSPVVNAIADYTIPKSTPFVLTDSATDPDGDALTYCWEQVDVGGPGGQWNLPSGDAPIFRSFVPVIVPYRYFPKLSDVINNTTTIGEIMPSYTRTMHFRLTARDNHAGGGGVCNAENAVTVDATSGPFVVTYPDAVNIVWDAGNFVNVTWNPTNTQNAPVNCSKVSIQLSTDGGLTYPVTLVDSTANTGSVQVQVPHNVTTTARIRVMAVGNIFYDISNNNFTIQDTTIPITWISFTATPRTNNTTLLNWVVNEGNVDHYVIERSPDSISFDTIASVKSVSGNGINQQYSYTDLSPLQGINYYRIKEVNKNGSFTYSTIIHVSFTNIPFAWTIYQITPLNGNVFIQTNGNADNVILQLFDAVGKLVYKKNIGSIAIGEVKNYTFEKFPKGAYILKVSSAAHSKSKEILVQ